MREWAPFCLPVVLRSIRSTSQANHQSKVSIQARSDPNKSPCTPQTSRNPTHTMDLLNTIKDAVIPDPNSIPNTEHATADHAADDVPGAFPDADDAELARQIKQKEANQSHLHHDSTVTVPNNQTGSAPPKLASMAAPGDYTPQPDLGAWNPPGGVTGDKSSAQGASRGASGLTGATSNVGADYGSDGMSNIREVKAHHLGNEGKALGSTGSSGLETASKNPDISAPFGSESATTREPASEFSRQQPGAQAVGSVPHSGGNTSPGVLQEAAGLSKPTPQHDQSTESSSRDPVLGSSHQQTDNQDLASATQSGGNTGSSVLREAAVGTGLSGSTPSQQQASSRSEPAAGYSGGIHNGVFGAGSDDVKGERIEGQHERTSHYRKGDVSSSLSGVSESGLGQGGVHNGVVGLGSREEEALRQSLDGHGQRDEFQA
ncbi:hypothetical protein BD289DRAFT_426191 [Coniella lustricola]|uniref:Uncharacterized protein n=1 Tax=Coniella lustricola TaxID=2025994 RepID=A0A2T3AGR5_9PEZI|nr:hypothetical protein BD289DRAFT_426191 [Coniella lustricola]